MTNQDAMIMITLVVAMMFVTLSCTECTKQDNTERNAIELYKLEHSK